MALLLAVQPKKLWCMCAGPAQQELWPTQHKLPVVRHKRCSWLKAVVRKGHAQPKVLKHPGPHEVIRTLQMDCSVARNASTWLCALMVLRPAVVLRSAVCCLLAADAVA